MAPGITAIATPGHTPGHVSFLVADGGAQCLVIGDAVLTPALFMAHLHGNLPPSTRIIASGRNDYGREGYIDFVQQHSRPFIDDRNFEEQAWNEFLAMLNYISLDATDPAAYAGAVLGR